MSLMVCGFGGDIVVVDGGFVVFFARCLMAGRPVGIVTDSS